ncbi:MAG: hypothetical protein BRC40_04570 [Cyanobacteria bacterium QH_8_48_120]|nr:MAG: hypothetical protein BRC40_04570 [Cyanobacteria bacterium QH_8_48_120]
MVRLLVPLGLPEQVIPLLGLLVLVIPGKNAVVCGGWSEPSASRARQTKPDPSDSNTIALELDELWSFVIKKANKRWIWITLCRRTRQVVAYVIGDRSETTCRKLREYIPESYRHGLCYTDFWQAYQLVIRP